MVLLGRCIHWQPDYHLEVEKADEAEVIRWLDHKKTKDYTPELIHRIIYAAQSMPPKEQGRLIGHTYFDSTLRSMIFAYLSTEITHPFVWRLLKDDAVEIDPSLGWKNLPLSCYAPVASPEERETLTCWFAGENFMLEQAMLHENIRLVLKLLSIPRVFFHLQNPKQQKLLKKTFTFMSPDFFESLMKEMFRQKLVLSTFGSVFEAVGYILDKAAKDESVFSLVQNINRLDFSEVFDFDDEMKKHPLNIERELESFASAPHLKASLEKETAAVLNVYAGQESFSLDRVFFLALSSECFDVFSVFKSDVSVQMTEFVSLLFRSGLRHLAKSYFFHHLKRMLLQNSIPDEALDFTRLICMLAFANDVPLFAYLDQLFNFSSTIKGIRARFQALLKGEVSSPPDWKFSVTMKEINPLLTFAVLDHKEMLEDIEQRFSIPDDEIEALVLLGTSLRDSIQTTRSPRV